MIKELREIENGVARLSLNLPKLTNEGVAQAKVLLKKYKEQVLTLEKMHGLHSQDA